MKNPALKLAMGEFRDHKGVYIAIILVVSLSMSVFITQSALNEYNDYVTDKTIKTMYGDGVVVAGGTPLRNVISGAPPMTDAMEIAKKINAISGFSAIIRAEGEGGAVHKELEAHSRSAGEADGGTYWGIDVESDEKVCALKDKIVEGKYFESGKDYTQAGLGAPGGIYVARTFDPFFGDYAAGWYKYDSGAMKAYPVLVGRAAASIHKLRLGEVFIGTWMTDQGVSYNDVFLEIIGIYETGKPLFESINYIVPIESMQEIKGWNTDTANYVCVKAPAGMSEDEMAAKMKSAIGDQKTFYSASDLKTIWEGNLGAMGKFILYVTIAASLLLAVAAVKYVMDSIIIRKQREIGTLKALGARDRTVASIFFYQALIIGILSAGLGLFISIAIMQLISYYGLSVPYVLGSKMEIKFILSPMTIALAFAIPIIVSLGAAVIPCLNVAHLSPLEAIRQGELQGSKIHMKKHSVGDVIKNALPLMRGKINSFTLAFDEIRDHKVIYGTIITVIAIALAVFMMQSAYQESMTRNITGAVRDTLSSDGMLLAGNANQRTMFGGAPRIENAVDIAKEIEQKTGYRAVARSNNQNIVEFTQGSATIMDGGSFWGIDVKADDDVMKLQSKIVGGKFFDPNADYSQNVVGWTAQVIPGMQYNGVGSMMLVAQLETPYPVLIGKSAATAHNVGVGDIITFLITNSQKGINPSNPPPVPGAPVIPVPIDMLPSEIPTSFSSGIVSCTFQIIGIYDTHMPLVDALMYFTPRVAINEMMGYGANDGNAIVVKAPGNPEYTTIYDTIHAAAPDMQAFSWHEAVLFFSGASFDALTLIIYTAIAITLALVAISIKYAMDSTVDRKTREIGTLKALGARDRMVVQIFLYQGLFIGIAAGLFSIVLAYAAIYAAINIFQIQSQLPLGMLMKVGFTITPIMIAITMIAPTIVSMVAAYMPSRRASKLSPVEALRRGDLNL
ncbi:MAG: FtsX-like permease family protein [Candidatus Thermoplasmatota archaeon]|nr:FtsX-like permease family protein [Candidatus Thermoplasmatota archaeon]